MTYTNFVVRNDFCNTYDTYRTNCRRALRCTSRLMAFAGAPAKNRRTGYPVRRPLFITASFNCRRYFLRCQARRAGHLSYCSNCWWNYCLSSRGASAAWSARSPGHL